MARVSTYLNFNGNTEEAFNFYKSIFGTEFDGDGINRMSEVPMDEDQPPLPEADKNLVMHVALPTLGDHMLMGTDVTSTMEPAKFGNNIYINLEPDTRAETDRLFSALSEGGEVEMELQEMFWGDYFGSCADKFGVRWMFNCSSKE